MPHVYLFNKNKIKATPLLSSDLVDLCFGVQYIRNGRHELMACNDSDYAGDMDDRKSTLDMC